MTDSINTTSESTVSAKPVLTKDEKIAAIKAQIAKLELKLYNVENDIVEAVRVKKTVVLPAVGETIVFKYGRKTANTEPEEIVGTVVAVKAAAQVDGKTLPAQVRVSYGEGFDAALATIYPAAIVSIGSVATGNEEDDGDAQSE